MSDYAVTQVGSSNYVGAVVPYQQQASMGWQPPAHAMDVYIPPSDYEHIAYRYADASEIESARGALVYTLNYYADHQIWGWSLFLTKSTVAERFRELIRNMVFGEVLFPPEAIFDPLEIHESRQVKSRKHHLQNLFVDRNPEETAQQRQSCMELEVLRIWAKCVDETTHDAVDNPNARALCGYTDYLIEGAQRVLWRSNPDRVRKLSARFEALRASLNSTIGNNERAYQELYGASA